MGPKSRPIPRLQIHGSALCKLSTSFIPKMKIFLSSLPRRGMKWSRSGPHVSHHPSSNEPTQFHALAQSSIPISKDEVKGTLRRSNNRGNSEVFQDFAAHMPSFSQGILALQNCDSTLTDCEKRKLPRKTFKQRRFKIQFT